MRAFACVSIFVVMVCASSAQTKFGAFGFLWEKRNGMFGGQMYDPQGVTTVNGRIQIELTGTSGGGIKLLTNLGFGIYEVHMSARLDMLNPNAFVAAWLYDDRPEKTENFEMDFEWSQWGDQNDWMRVMLSVANKVAGGTPEIQQRFPVRSFEKHRIYLDYEPNVVRVTCDGWREITQTWVNYGFIQRDRVSHAGATLRIAVNLLNGAFLPGTQPGNNRIYIDNVIFRPLG